MSFTRGQQSLDYHRVAGVGSVRKARNTVKQRIISDTAASTVSLKVVGGRIHTVWTVSLQGMTPRCSAGTLFLCHAPRGSRNTHAQRGRTVSCRWCVFVYPGLQLSDFHVTPVWVYASPHLSQKWCLHTKEAKDIHTKITQPELSSKSCD